MIPYLTPRPGDPRRAVRQMALGFCLACVVAAAVLAPDVLRVVCAWWAR